MKAQRRHELQQNVLGAELSKIAGFIKAHSNLLAWLLLLAVVVFFVWWWVSNSRARARAEMEAEYVNLVLQPNPELKPEERLDKLKDLARRDSDKHRAAMENYEIGREYAARMLFAGSETERKNLAEQANQYYRIVIDKYPEVRVAVAKARLGLGKVAEGLGEFNTARTEYQTVAGMTDMAGNPLVDIANESIAALDQLETPVRMATTAPSTQPATSSAPASHAASGPATGPAAVPATKAAPTPAKAPLSRPASAASAGSG